MTPPPVRLDLGAELTVAGLPADIERYLERLNAFENPEFKRRSRNRRITVLMR
jgi:hypothetical protein